MKRNIIGLIIGSLLGVMLAGCGIHMSNNQKVVAWATGCSKIVNMRNKLGNEANAGDFTAVNKAELKKLDLRALALCSTAPTPANQVSVENKVTSLLADFVTFEAVNSGIRTIK